MSLKSCSGCNKSCSSSTQSKKKSCSEDCEGNCDDCDDCKCKKKLDGCFCRKCGQFYEFSISDGADGKITCWGCKNGY